MPGDGPDDGGPESFATMAFHNEEAFQAFFRSPVFAEAVRDSESPPGHHGTRVAGHVRVI